MIAHPFVHRRARPGSKTRRAIAADIIRVKRRIESADKELPPFAKRDLRGPVRREFQEADRLGRGKPA